MTLEVGTPIYIFREYGVSKTKIDRVTNTLAFAGSYKFKRNEFGYDHDSKGENELKEIPRYSLSGRACLVTESTTARYLKRIAEIKKLNAIRFLNDFNFKEVSDEDLNAVYGIVEKYKEKTP